MKKLMAVVCLMAAAVWAVAQEKESSQNLPHFTKITVSPRIHVVLSKGTQESVRLVCHQVDPSQVNVVVTAKRLRIYLDHARVVERRERILRHHRHEWHSIYQDVSVTAYVTYREVKDIEVRGNQEFVCNDEINAVKLKIRAYGEANIQLARVNTEKFKASLYGENRLNIQSGSAGRQVYRLFGENRIDTRGLKSENTFTRIYGEGKLSVSASHLLHVHAFGLPEINVTGSPHVNRGIVIGHADIRRQ